MSRYVIYDIAKQDKDIGRIIRERLERDNKQEIISIMDISKALVDDLSLTDEYNFITPSLLFFKYSQMQKAPILNIDNTELIDMLLNTTSYGKRKAHIRSGHFRNQPYGSGEDIEYKTIWIEPTFIDNKEGNSEETIIRTINKV